MLQIAEFKGEYRFLSNFWLSPVRFNGIVFSSVEHAYQAAKTVDSNEQIAIYRASRPGDAKRLGQRVKLRADWNEVRLGIMLDLVREKFQEPALRKLLLETGDAELIEGNWWGDKFWGVCRGTGLNHLGKILMQVRQEVKSNPNGG